SLMLVRGRSEPRAVSVCQRPFSSSYSIVSVWPGNLCSSAAACAAASASAWVGEGSEKTPSTLYAQPPSCSTIPKVISAIGVPPNSDGVQNTYRIRGWFHQSHGAAIGKGYHQAVSN